MAIRAYEGSKPYIFISYAHKDKDIVMPILEALEGCGFRLWYDAGIEVGTEWPEYIAEHLDQSSRFLAFASKNFVASQNCRREINFAIDLKKDPIVIYLEEFELSLGMRMQLGSLQALPYYRHESFESFIGALTRVKELMICREVASDQTEEEIAETLDGMLRDGMFEGIKSYCRSFLDNGVENTAIYRAMLLAEFSVKSEEELVAIGKPLEMSLFYHSLLRVADEVTKRRFMDCAAVIESRSRAKAKNMQFDSHKRSELLQAQINASTTLARQREEWQRASARLNADKAERDALGNPKRTRTLSIAVIAFAFLNLVLLFSMIENDGETLNGWLATGAIYLILSIVHIKATHKSFGWWFLNLATLNAFSWIYAITCLKGNKKCDEIEKRIAQGEAYVAQLAKSIQKTEANLKKIEAELNAL